VKGFTELITIMGLIVVGFYVWHREQVNQVATKNCAPGSQGCFNLSPSSTPDTYTPQNLPGDAQLFLDPLRSLKTF
jgi:hypothetical protein